MGFSYKYSFYSQINIKMSPIVYCVNKDKVYNLKKEYVTVSLNEVLSKRLLSYNQEKRKLFINDEINDIINNIDGQVLLDNIEILFDPSYEIDVIKTFVLLNRRKKVDVIWPGKFEKGNLVFAEPGYKDYKSYNINDYDITCII